MAQVLGLDAGGTKTLAVLADIDAKILRVTQGPGMDPTTGSNAEVALHDCLGQFGAVVTATLGLPYHDEVPEITRWQTEIAVEVLGSGARVMNDVALAHMAAFAGGEGCLILSGTGSMAWAQGPKGAHRAGGYGDLFGDEGSAYWIGREALAAASRQIDGRAADSGFATALWHLIGITQRQMMNWAYALPDRRLRIASLARHVSALAVAGDAVAQDILDRAADELAIASRAAASATGLPEPITWSHAGGVFAAPGIVAALSDRLGTGPLKPRLPPVGGGVLDAARRAGWDTPDDWIAALSRNLAVHGVT